VSRELSMNRRRFLGAAAGTAAGAGILGGLKLDSASSARGTLVPQGKRSIILYSVRDRIGAATDMTGIPYGFALVLERLAQIGYHGIEFAGYTQNTAVLGRQITPAEIRQILDDNGLIAVGSHGSIPTDLNNTGQMDAFKVHMETALTLGQQYVGTGNDPTGGSNSPDQKPPWDAAIERWNVLGEMAAANGLKLYTHNHDSGYKFLLDTADPDGNLTRSSGVRKLVYFLQNTDPRYVHLEMDIYWAHVAQHRWRTYTAADGTTVEDVFDPGALVAGDSMRFPLFHAKDGKRDDTVAAGYVMVPLGAGDIDFTMFFDNMGAKGFHYPMWEQDNAPGGSADPGRSLRYAAESYAAMKALRG